MILDTTYLLPLARIAVDTDLLGAIARKEVDLKFRDLAVSLVSIFELQAKAAKLSVPAQSTIRAVQAISAGFRIEPFHSPGIIETSYDLRRMIPDYLDCVIVATAVVLKEDLATEDSLILDQAERMAKKYGTHVLTFRDITALRPKE